MKIITNLDKDNYITLPSGVTINAGGSMRVLNDAILESAEIKKMLQQKKIEIGDISDELDKDA